jgi:hypothetical protein
MSPGPRARLTSYSRAWVLILPTFKRAGIFETHWSKPRLESSSGRRRLRVSRAACPQSSVQYCIRTCAVRVYAAYAPRTENAIQQAHAIIARKPWRLHNAYSGRPGHMAGRREWKAREHLVCYWSVTFFRVQCSSSIFFYAGACAPVSYIDSSEG